MLKRPLLPIALVVLFGICAERFGLDVLAVFVFGAGVMLCGVLFYGNKRIPGFLTLLCLLLMAGAFYRSRDFSERWQDSFSRINDLEDCRLTLQLTESPLISGKSAFHEGRIGNSFELNLNGSVRIYGLDPELLPGDTVTILFSPFPVGVPACENSFDRRSYMEREGLISTGRCREEYSREVSDSFSLSRELFLLRRRMVRNTMTAVKGGEGGFLSAVMYGCREAVDKDDKSDFGKAGTGHLLAISGLHVGLITALCWFVLRRLGLSLRASAIISICACLFYLGISGLRPSAVRAGVMTIIYLGGFLFQRKSDLLNSLACAGALIMLYFPPVVVDAGFQMSFIAVLFLSRLGHEFNLWRARKPRMLVTIPGYYTIPEKILNRLHRWVSVGWGLLLMSVAAWVGLWPLTAWYFKTISFGGIFLNILIIPFLPVVIAGGALAQLAAVTGINSPELFLILSTPARLILILNRLVADTGGLYLSVNPPAVWVMVVYYAVFSLFFIREKFRLKARWFSVPALAAVTCAVLTMLPAAPPENARLTIIPDGYGNCVLAEFPDGRVYAAGIPRRGGATLGDYIRNSGRGRLDGFVDLAEDGKTDIKELQRQFSDFPVKMISLISSKPQDSGRTSPFPDFYLTPIKEYKGSVIGWKATAGNCSAIISDGWWWDSFLRYARDSNELASCSVLAANIKNRSTPGFFREGENDTFRKTSYKQENRYNLSPELISGKAVFISSFDRIRLPSSVNIRSNWGAIRLEPSAQSEKSQTCRITAYDGEKWTQPGIFMSE